MNIPENDPIDEVRSDLWGEMNLKQLDNQRMLLSKRLQAIQTVMSSGMTNPTTIGLRAAMEHAMEILNSMIVKQAK